MFDDICVLYVYVYKLAYVFLKFTFMLVFVRVRTEQNHQILNTVSHHFVPSLRMQSENLHRKSSFLSWTLN